LSSLPRYLHPMADDARISTAFPRHPKTVKLQRRLGATGCWSLVCLFLWVADNRPDGNLSGMSDEDIEIAAGWSGDSNTFVGALVEVGFLDGQDGIHSIHDWVEHNPWAATRGERIAKAKKAAAARWGTDASSMLDACSPHATGMQEPCLDAKRAMPSTRPNPTQPNPTVKPSDADASVADDTEPSDPRHAQIRQSIQELHLQTFRVKCQWDGSEGKALDRLLSANPSWTAEELIQMVRNRFRSEGITSDRPRKWLPNLGGYAAGPQDRFNKLKDFETSGNGKPSIGQIVEREQAILRARRAQ
jgi:hypothetical protein